MAATANQLSIRIVGANGQISLSKQFAGRQVLVEERELGVWLVTTATVAPDFIRLPAVAPGHDSTYGRK